MTNDWTHFCRHHFSIPDTLSIFWNLIFKFSILNTLPLSEGVVGSAFNHCLFLTSDSLLLMYLNWADKLEMCDYKATNIRSEPKTCDLFNKIIQFILFFRTNSVSRQKTKIIFQYKLQQTQMNWTIKIANHKFFEHFPQKTFFGTWIPIIFPSKRLRCWVGTAFYTNSSLDSIKSTSTCSNWRKHSIMFFKRDSHARTKVKYSRYVEKSSSLV